MYKCYHSIYYIANIFRSRLFAVLETCFVVHISGCKYFGRFVYFAESAKSTFRSWD